MIEPTTVRKVARLARLQLDDDAVQRVAAELGRVLEHVARLEELDVSDVPPLMHATGGTDVYRDDVAERPLRLDQAIANAPDAGDGCFRVPRILGDA